MNTKSVNYGYMRKEQNKTKPKTVLSQKGVKVTLEHECDLCHRQWTTHEPILNSVMGLEGQTKHSEDVYEAHHATCSKCYYELINNYTRTDLVNMLIDTHKQLGKAFIPVRKV